MLRRQVSLCLMSAWLGCASTQTGQEAEAPPPQSVPDTQIGLYKGSVFEVSTPEPVVYVDNAPGEKGVLPRQHADAPPVIPHDITDMLPITQSENLCVDCHAGGDGKAIPKSHFTDYRNAPDKVGEKLIGARYVCVSCHVQQSKSAPLVENSLPTYTQPK